jgi:hypothetical protein
MNHLLQQPFTTGTQNNNIVMLCMSQANDGIRDRIGTDGYCHDFLARNMMAEEKCSFF